MKINTLLVPMAFLLSAASFNANSASVSAGSNTGNSAGWPDPYERTLKLQVADLIKKAEEGGYGSPVYNTTYKTHSYSYSSTVEYYFEIYGEDFTGCGENNDTCPLGGADDK